MKRGFYLILLVIILFLPINAYALGVVPGKVIIPFSPFREESFIFEIFGPKIVKAETDCPDIITINKTIKANGPDRAKVLADVKLPERMEPGPRHCGISITELPEKGQQVGISVKIIVVVEIDVPYPGKYAKMSISANNVMPEEDLKIYTTIINLGTDDLDAQADVIIKDYKNNTVKLKKTDHEIILSKVSKQFVTTISAGTLNSGKYIVKAIYDYGAEVIFAETPFVIGQLNLELTNYTHAIKSGAISPFSVIVTSLWGNPLEDAYAEIRIYGNDSQLISTTKTSVATIAPYSVEIINGFIDATNISSGNYNADIILKSNNLEFVNKVNINVERQVLGKEFMASPYIFIFIIIAIIITDAIYMMLLRRRYIYHQKKLGVEHEIH